MSLQADGGGSQREAWIEQVRTEKQLEVYLRHQLDDPKKPLQSGCRGNMSDHIYRQPGIQID